jgi:Na+/melibiose symporter-like transporter
MFRGLINDARSAVGSLAAKYLARASVAAPFVIAIGFALAAITLMLIERLGAIAAYWIMAGGLAAVGLMAAFIVSVKEQKEELAEQQAEQEDTETVATDAAAQAIVQTPIALLGALFTMPGGPTTALSIARLLGRNWPLVLLLVATSMLFWPTETTGQVEADDTDADDTDMVRKPDGADHMPSEVRH